MGLKLLPKTIKSTIILYYYFYKGELQFSTTDVSDVYTTINMTEYFYYSSQIYGSYSN